MQVEQELESVTAEWDRMQSEHEAEIEKIKKEQIMSEQTAKEVHEEVLKK